jgi:hypothetical protein
MKKIFILLVGFAFTNVYAVDWVCYKTPISRIDTISLYSGQPIYRDGRFITGCMLTADNLLSIEAFGQLGIRPEVSASLARSTGLVERKIKIVKNENDMISCIKDNNPAVGYLYLNNDQYMVHCFKP